MIFIITFKNYDENRIDLVTNDLYLALSNLIDMNGTSKNYGGVKSLYFWEDNKEVASINWFDSAKSQLDIYDMLLNELNRYKDKPFYYAINEHLEKCKTDWTDSKKLVDELKMKKDEELVRQNELKLLKELQEKYLL